MSQTVNLKSNRYGINLILDQEVNFPQLLSDIETKFKEAESFFKNAKMAISFEGRELTQEEELQIVNTITSSCSLSILCIVDNNTEQEQRLKEVLETMSQTEPMESTKVPREEDACRTGQFYQGTLRSGQVLECETSVVIVGDINPGAKIISLGNIVVLGSLKGNAYAGAGGNDCAFVVALDMDPVQIRIGNVIARSADKVAWPRSKKKKKKEPVVEPQVAIVKEGNIYIEPITKGLFNTL